MYLLHRATCGLLVLLLALTACRKRDEGPEDTGKGPGAPGRVETEAVAGDLPAGAAVVVSLYDLESFWTRLKSTQLYTQLRAIPQVDSLLSPATNPQLARGLQQFQATVGVPLNEQTLFNTVGKKIQIGIYPKSSGAGAATGTAPSPDTTGGAGMGDQRVVLVADMGDKDALASIASSLRAQAEGQGAKFTTEQYKGVDVTVVSSGTGEVRGLYGFHKEKLVAATDQAGLQNAVNALDGEGTMEEDSLYQRALTHVGDANITFFVRKSGYKDLVGAMMEAGEAAGASDTVDPGAMLQVMDKYNIQTATIVGSGWSDEGLQVQSYSMLDRNALGAGPLIDMLKTPPSTVEVVGYFPDSTLGFYAVNFLDATKIYEFAVSYLKDVAGAGGTGQGEAVAAQIDQGIAQFQAASGMDIRNDILSWMGKEMALGLNGVVKGGFFPVPEFSLVVQATDPARAKAFFDKLEARITQAMQESPQGFPVQFQQEDYKGVQVRYAPTPMGEGLAPAYALHDDYALIALSRATVKRMLDAKTGAVPAVRSNAQFESLSGFYPGEANLVGFLNMAQLLNEISSMLTTFQQMSGQQASPQTQDTMTRVINALKNVQAAGTYGLNDARGVEQRFLVKIQ